MERSIQRALEALRTAVEAFEATTEPSRRLSMRELRRRLSKRALLEALVCSCPNNRDDCEHCYPAEGGDN
jgi:hypothetical protein